MDRKEVKSSKRIPSGRKEYFSAYGYHFSKKLCEFAVSRMKKKDNLGNDISITPYSKEDVENLLSENRIELKNNLGYDACYVANMCKADYLGSSIVDDKHLALFVKNYLDDPDGSPTRAFDEYLVNCLSMEIPLMWEDYL